MRAGSLRHRVVLELGAVTRETDGGEVVSWTSNVSCNAAIWPLTNREYATGKEIRSAATHRVRIRYMTFSGSTEITAENCRVKFGSRTFNVHGVLNPDERNISLDLMCSEDV